MGRRACCSCIKNLCVLPPTPCKLELSKSPGHGCCLLTLPFHSPHYIFGQCKSTPAMGPRSSHPCPKWVGGPQRTPQHTRHDKVLSGNLIQETKPKHWTLPSDYTAYCYTGELGIFKLVSCHMTFYRAQGASYFHRSLPRHFLQAVNLNIH